MTDKSNFEDESASRGVPDAHGQAALLLVESMLHGLLEKDILSIDDALAITASAAEVKEDVIAEHREPASAGRLSIELIERISASLGIDRKG